MRRVIKKLKEQNQKKRVRGKTLNKSFSDYSDRQKIRIKNTIKEECLTTLTFLGLYNLVPAKVEIYNEEQNKMEVIPLLDDDEFLKNIDSLDKDSDASLTDQQIDDITLMLYVKDRFQVSDQAWHELSQLAGDIPSLYGIKKRMEQLNSKWNIFFNSRTSRRCTNKVRG